MKNGTLPLVIGNWKMNPLSVTLATKLAKQVKDAVSKVRDVEVVIAPPALYLESVHRVKSGSKQLQLGAQNVHHEKLGAHTGEMSVPMLASFDVTHVIIGHSERRAAGETDAHINAKCIAAIKAGLTSVLCVGEKKRDEGGQYLSHIEAQIRSGLAQVSRTKLERVVIAYEPVWAIGTGDVATPADVHVIRLFIEKVLSDMYGRNYARKVRVLYGGSVNANNVQELFLEGTVDGFLVGGASINAAEFAAIVKQVHTAIKLRTS